MSSESAPTTPFQHQGPPAGRHQDPEGSGRQRWWDGSRWTEHYRDAVPPPAAASSPPAPASRATIVFFLLAVVLAGLGFGVFLPQDDQSMAAAFILGGFVSALLAGGFMIRHPMRGPEATPTTRVLLVFLCLVALIPLILAIASAADPG